MMSSPGTTASFSLLYIGLKYDYGTPERGLSYENVNFLETLKRMEGVKVDFFPVDQVMRKTGRVRMNELLLETVKKQQPDACFFVLYTDDISKETIRYITESSGAVTLNWFGDDHWRFTTFSRYWAPLFHWVVTTDSEALQKYYEIGCRNVIKSQWAVNHYLYRPVNVTKDFDVTFVGQVHSDRERIIKELKRADINVECWGKGWKNGRLTQEEMVRMYSRSRINLNFTASSPVFQWKPLVKVFLCRRADGTFRMNNPKEMADTLAMLAGEKRSQIKGRNFEIPGSGGFLLTERADNLQEYFVAGREIATFEGTDDLIDKIRNYLTNEHDREEIRRAGHERTLREHTYEKRFERIFRTIGLRTNSSPTESAG
jgi:spore maturation protein CgeB